MLRTAQNHTIPLPKGWPRCVRSAVLHAISLARFSLIAARGWAANSWNARIRLKQDISRLRQELALLHEETRIKDSRMERIPPQRRPHYLPLERLAILELRAVRGWSLSQTAERLLVTPATVASWMGRLDDEGPDALVQIRKPVNRFPDFVAYLVRRLKVLCPTMGKSRIAQLLCRAGLHLGSTTVARMLEQPLYPRPATIIQVARRSVQAARPNDVWHVDLTTVPTSLGFWTSWLPFAMPQRWPFCWWVTVAIDHFSRRIMGLAVHPQQPTSAAVRVFLGRAISKTGTDPRYFITDHGVQFVSAAFRSWCHRRGIRQRFGAIGRYGSLAVVERLIRTMKEECTRRLVVPFHRAAFLRELVLFVDWYNGDRPHTRLEARTPDEVYYGRPAASLVPRFEPRQRWPRDAPCAAPQTAIRGCCGTRLELHIRFRLRRKHLPIVELNHAA
jgi:putative transposase